MSDWFFDESGEFIEVVECTSCSYNTCFKWGSISFFLSVGYGLLNYYFWLWTVYTNGSDHFVLRNASVQLTISKRRITSLVDVKLKLDFFSLDFSFLWGVLILFFFLVKDSFRKGRVVVWLFSKIDRIPSMRGVSYLNSIYLCSAPILLDRCWNLSLGNCSTFL